MSFAGLVRALRGLFWGLVYLGTVLASVIVFAPAGPLLWVALAGVLFVIAHDARMRFAT